ncbi:MAG TPA: hypothetical protein VFW94_23640 [Candidatus Acidoferrales bacterium]|nr:hypothetical protein [Candidatus Acidoferrales bacterium]
MTREELIARFVWTADGVVFHHACGEDDWASTICLTEPSAKYSDDELGKLAAFADEQDAEYDRVLPRREGCNLTVIDKCADGRWMRKRLTWYLGPMHSPDLDAALAFLRRKPLRISRHDIDLGTR